jgi:hypothetical protein
MANLADPQLIVVDDVRQRVEPLNRNWAWIPERRVRSHYVDKCDDGEIIVVARAKNHKGATIECRPLDEVVSALSVVAKALREAGISRETTAWPTRWMIALDSRGTAELQIIKFTFGRARRVHG